jgi:putative redox protein
MAESLWPAQEQFTASAATAHKERTPKNLRTLIQIYFAMSRREMMQTAIVKWISKEEFLATLPSGHAVRFDADRKENTAPGPMEMLLGALGVCSSVDVVSILAKKRQKLESLEILISGERASEPPAVWTKIDMVYKLTGELEEQAVRRAIELSQTKYCSVAAMLGKTATIAYRFEIAPSTP